ncbi:MAG: phospho-N-acetylmuramoyl-pentapeptide-transferase [Parachlamydiales bacterium]|jgi:phospho-N-acetylmuramoyl-pentapeptide-transferase
MLFLLIELLQNQFGTGVFSILTYTSTRMILAAATSLLLCISLGPWMIKKLYELKIGQSIRMEECPLLGQLHFKKKDTPTMGGLLILTAMLVSLLLFMDPRSPFTLILFCTTLVLGGLGATDDYLKIRYKNTKGLPAKAKLAIQVGLSILLALYLVWPAMSNSLQVGNWFIPPIVKEQPLVRLAVDTSYLGSTEQWTTIQRTLSIQDVAARIFMPFFRDPLITFTGIGLILAALLIIIVVTGSSNAVNLTDGLDGLAAGNLILVASCLAIVAFFSNNIELARYLNLLYIQGAGEIAIYLFALCGACLGFLWYNGHPAQVFMGDTGSLALGGIIGVSAVLIGKVLFLALVGGIFVAEAVSVILQVGSYKLRNKKRIFLCAPLHHHFEYKGWPETKVVLRFWIIGLLLALGGLASIKLG